MLDREHPIWWWWQSSELKKIWKFLFYSWRSCSLRGLMASTINFKNVNQTLELFIFFLLVYCSLRTWIIITFKSRRKMQLKKTDGNEEGEPQCASKPREPTANEMVVMRTPTAREAQALLTLYPQEVISHICLHCYYSTNTLRTIR